MKPTPAVSLEVDGSRSSAGKSRRRRGARAASSRYDKMAAGQNLRGHKEQLLRMTGRLICHFENASDRLFDEGELTTEGEPKQVLSRLLDLNRQVVDNLAVIFDGEADDPFTALRGGGE